MKTLLTEEEVTEMAENMEANRDPVEEENCLRRLEAELQRNPNDKPLKALIRAARYLQRTRTQR